MTVQLAAGARLEGQLLVWLKSAVLPVTLKPVKLRGALPELVSTTACGALGLPTTWLLKVTDDGEKLTAGAVVAVPVRLTVWGLVGSASLIWRVAEREPPAVGEKTTLMVQVPLVGTLEPQVLVGEKSPLLGPVIAMPLMPRGLPTLVRTTV